MLLICWLLVPAARPRRPRHRLCIVRKPISLPSSPDSASVSRRSTREFGSSPSSTMIWVTSTWSRKPYNPSTTRWAKGVTHFIGTCCHPCLRAVPSHAATPSQSCRPIPPRRLGAEQQQPCHRVRRDSNWFAEETDWRHVRGPLELVDHLRAHRSRRGPEHRLDGDQRRSATASCRSMASLAGEDWP